MDFQQEIDCYIKSSIEHSLGLPVNEQALNMKLKAYDEVHKRLRRENLFLLSKLNEKDGLVEKAREESRMNAQALKKFVEENTNLVLECGNLLAQCSKWEKEVSLYDHDREALMDFGNEADERAKQSENRVCELEEKVKELSDELNFYKVEAATGAKEDGAEEQLLESVLTCLAPQADDDAVSPPAFLNTNMGVAACETLHQTWKDLKLTTRRMVSLVGEVVALRADKENLRFNLNRAEDEVEMLFTENNILDEENKKLLIHCSRKRNCCTGSAKQAKRKQVGGMVGKLEFGEMDSPRQPLSPLLHNSSALPLPTLDM